LQQVAAFSLFLATKTEENCRKMKELIVACCRVAQKNPNLEVDDSSKDYWRWRDTILMNEDVLLETLCFDLTVESPHKILFELLKDLGVEHNKKLRNAAWAFVNDSSLTMLCLLLPARTIAASAVYGAMRFCGEDAMSFFPDDEQGRSWWDVQKVKLEDIKRAVTYMADLYENKHASGDASIYTGLRTPEHGASGTPGSPGSGTEPAVGLKRERTESLPREQEKNSLTVEEEVVEDGIGEGERLQKKPKIHANGVKNAGHAPKPEWVANAKSVATAKSDQGSEEGELVG